MGSGKIKLNWDDVSITTIDINIIRVHNVSMGEYRDFKCDLNGNIIYQYSFLPSKKEIYIINIIL